MKHSTAAAKANGIEARIAPTLPIKQEKNHVTKISAIVVLYDQHKIKAHNWDT